MAAPVQGLLLAAPVQGLRLAGGALRVEGALALLVEGAALPVAEVGAER